MKEPAVVVFLNFALGIILGHFFHFSISLIPAGLIAFLLIIMLIISAGLNRARTCTGLITSFLLGFLWVGFAQNYFQKQAHSLPSNIRNPVGLIGVLSSAPEIQHGRMKWILRAEYVLSRDSIFTTRAKLLVSSKDTSLRLQIGQRVFLRGYLSRPPGRRNPGEFDYRAYLARRNISALFYLKRGEPVKVLSEGHGKFFQTGLIASLRRMFSYQITHHLGQTEEAFLLKGLLLGQRGQIDPEIQQRFARTGVIHVLAVSGLHVGFILLLLMGIFSLLRMPETPRTVVVILALIVYAILTGGKPPVVRAVLMAAIILLGYLLQRRAAVLNSLAVAALILLMVNPFMLFDAGFQLSFLAVLGIVLFYSRILNFFQFVPRNRLQRFVSTRLLPLLIVSFAAQLGTLPLTLYYFHRLPTYSLLANLVVVPLVFVIVALGFALIILGPVWPLLGSLLALPAKFLLTFLIQFVTFFSNLPGSAIETFGHFSLWYLMAYFILLGMVWLADNPRQVRQLSLGMIFLLLVWYGAESLSHLQPTLKVTFLDVGQGDGSIVEFPDGHFLIIDTGPRTESFDAGERIVSPFLRYERCHHLDAIMISHHHEDHVGGAPFLLAHLAVDEVWDNGDSLDQPIYRLYRDNIRRKKIPLRPVSAGFHRLNWHGASIWIFYPLNPSHKPGFADPSDKENNHSVVAKICFGSRSFLFTGDIEHPVEKQLLKFGELLKSDVLKVPHHGSKTSSTLQFLKTVDPHYAVISVGAHNRFHQPSPEILQRLKQLNIRTFRTDNKGAVIFSTNGKQLKKL